MSAIAGAPHVLRRYREGYAMVLRAMPEARKVPIPAPLARELKSDRTAKAAWEKLAPSNKKEYAAWIESAKKDETRAKRVALAVEKLAAGVKTPMRANDAPAISAAPLAKKLGIKDGMRVVALDAPDAVLAQLEGARKSGEADVVLAFARDSKALARVAPKALAAVRDGGLLWMAFPKKTSGITTDLSRDHGWDAVTREGWQGVSIVAIDDAWSALRLRPA